MLAQHYLLLHTLPMAAQTFGASAVILSPILNLFLVAAALLLFLTLIQNNFIRNMFAGIGFMSILNSLFSNDNSRGSRVYSHPAPFYPSAYYPYSGPDIHPHPSTYGHNFFNPVHGHSSTYRGASTHHRGPELHQHPSQNNFHPIPADGINGHPSEHRVNQRNPIHGHP